MTIHFFLNIGHFYDYNTGNEGFVQRLLEDENKAELLILDESSMLSNDLYNKVVEAVVSGNINTVLFIGDKYQLLPINEGISPVFSLQK